MAGAAPAGGDRLLRFRIGGERFALPATQVREVTRAPRLTRLPNAPAGLDGLANVRGTVIPVISGAALTGMASTGAGRLIVVERGEPVGLLVDGVEALGGPETGIERLDLEALLAERFSGAARAAERPRRGRTAAALRETVDARGLLSFEIAGRTFALPLEEIVEVLRAPGHVAAIPRGDAATLGTMPWRGGILPLFSLAALLGLAERGAATVIVVRIGAGQVGLAVPRFGAVLRVAEAAIDPLPPVLARTGAEARVQAIARVDGGRRLVSILAARELLRDELTEGLMRTAEPAVAQPAGETAPFLLFRLDGQGFALPLAAVREVTNPPRHLIRLPRAPEFVAGLMMLRSEALPVIDLAQRLAGRPAADKGRRVIVTRVDGAALGLLVDAVTELVRVPAEQVREVPGLAGEALFEQVLTESESAMTLVAAAKPLFDAAERDLLAAMRDAPAK